MDFRAAIPEPFEAGLDTLERQPVPDPDPILPEPRVDERAVLPPAPRERRPRPWISPCAVGTERPVVAEDLWAEGAFGGRRARRNVRAMGGSDATEAAVDEGLAALASRQAADGSVGAVRTTALALLAFLGAGETHRRGSHRATVARGLRFLLSRQGRDGRYAADPRTHAIATEAVVSGYAQTWSGRLEASARRAVAALERAPPKVTDPAWPSFVLGLRAAECAGLRWRPPLSTPRLPDAPTLPMLAGAAIHLSLGVCRDRAGRPFGEAVAEVLLTRGDVLNLKEWSLGTLAVLQGAGNRWREVNMAMKDHLLPLRPETAEEIALRTLTLTVYYRYGRCYGAG